VLSQVSVVEFGAAGDGVQVIHAGMAVVLIVYPPGSPPPNVYSGEVLPPGAPYCRPITAVDVAKAGSGTTLVRLMSATTVITRGSENAGDFAGVAEFAVSTTSTVSAPDPAVTVPTPVLSQVSVVELGAAGAAVQVIHAGMADVLMVYPPGSLPPNVYSGEVLPPGAPYFRPITAVDVPALPGSGTTLVRLMPGLIVRDVRNARAGNCTVEACTAAFPVSLTCVENEDAFATALPVVSRATAPGVRAVQPTLVSIDAKPCAATSAPPLFTHQP